MISEVVNSVFITYLVTEYSTLSHKNDTAKASLPQQPQQQRRRRSRGHRIGIAGAIVVTINVLDRISGMGNLLTVHSVVVNRFLHFPKILLAAAVYVIALYYDCQWTLARASNHINNRSPSSSSSSLRFGRDFCPRVARAFVRILPIYPILAVLASFGFLFVISAFEWLHWSTAILNWPIYYGTLYGPFSYIYWNVKSTVVDEFRNTIPISTHPPRRLGSL